MSEGGGPAPVPGSSGHPGPTSVLLRDALREALIEHARRDYPNEACGIIVGDRPAAVGGVALRFAATENVAKSRFRYEIDSMELYRLNDETERADEVFWAIVHSHVATPAVPSPTDIGVAQYPDALYILVSLADSEADPVSGERSVRGWRIVDGAVHEVELRREG